jgi:uncharacterized protein (TIGR02453 family)
MAQQGFAGFSPRTISFLTELRKHNEKAWFDANRDVYERHVKQPARDFVVAMGEKLTKIAPTVVADPRVNKSLFRINRDTRFSKDKTPYKTHMALWFWEGPSPARMENSGFYFHLDPPSLMVGAGMYRFPDPLLKAFREDVAHPVHGAALTDTIRMLNRKGLEVGGEHYKRVPRGFDPDHERADLLRYNGLFVGVRMGLPDEAYTPKLVDLCLRQYKKTLPLHQWLLAFSERHH